jgi:hypothetical protein
MEKRLVSVSVPNQQCAKAIINLLKQSKVDGLFENYDFLVTAPKNIVVSVDR